MYTHCSLLLLMSESYTSVPKPHLVFFLADDYGFADVSYHTKMYGNSSNVIETPHLDMLAMQGVRLENYYVQPVCSPTRSCIMTGRYTIHTGVHGAFSDSVPNALPIEETTIAQRLKNAGYATHAIGKWHLGFKQWKYTPQERGFDSFFGYYAGSSDYYSMQSLCWPDAKCFTNWTKTGEAVSGLDLHRNRDTVHNNSKYSTKLFTEEAVHVIASHAKRYGEKSSNGGTQMKPLFLYLPYQAVHVGNKPTPSHPEYALDQAPLQYIDQYSWVADVSRRNLSGMVTAMDEAARNVTDALKQYNMWPNTLFIFSTDNGGPLGQKASNYPLKGGKATLWEGGVRGIGFVTAGDKSRFGMTTAGGIVHGLMHVSDWLPTLCDKELGDCNMAAVVNPFAGDKSLPLDGVSAWGMIARNASSQRSEIVHEDQAIRMGTLKLIDGGEEPELYDVVVDAAETTNLANEPKYAAIVVEMQARLEYWKNESKDVINQMRLHPDPQSNPMLHNGVWLPWQPDNYTSPPTPAPPAPTPPTPVPVPTSFCKFIADMDQWPSTHQGKNAASPQECCAMCKEDAQCKVAVFTDRNKGCYFKPANATSRPRNGSISCLPVR